MNSGADSLSLNSYDETPLDVAAFGRRLWECPEDWFFDLNTPIENFKPSHFQIACTLGSILGNLMRIAQHILDNVNSNTLRMNFVNCRDDAGRTPLHSIFLQHSAQTNDEIYVIRLLIENGANVNARDCELQTPLHFLSDDVESEAVKHLIKNGADVNAQNLYGETPLHSSFAFQAERSVIDSRLNDPEVISLFLENGADINIVDERGRTWLMINLEDLDRLNYDYNGEPAPDTPGIISSVILRHVKKWMLIESHVSAQNVNVFYILRSRYRDFYDDDDFSGECKKELTLMKVTRIDRYTTLHDILLRNSNFMTFHCENETLQTMMESVEFNEKFPNYGFLVKLQVKKGKIRRPLVKISKTVLPHLFDRNLPPLCLEIILQYLSDTDLESIISSQL
ncbi:hypothetical protein QAD02_019079 [Eretmocerus hayati]|uniref:Uncharacterized protein n=1 Tax=Eretmocerus hayati TaxID=131215 RepID=A0ACC2PIU0_9HYME|nr:hypothetical protein QAD02_019079 [Eretmocerus hayati]